MPRRKKKYKTFHRNANIRASKPDGAVQALEARQRDVGANVIFSGRKGRKYKVVTRNYNTCVEEVFWFHVF